MGRYTDRMRAVRSAQAERDAVLALPRDEYFDYIAAHPSFRSSDAQLHGDAELYVMKELQAEFGRDVGLTWAHKRFWHGVGLRWRAENIAAATSRVEAFGLTLVFNGAKYGAVLAIAWLLLPPLYLAAFAPTFTAIIFGLSLCAAIMRKVI